MNSVVTLDANGMQLTKAMLRHVIDATRIPDEFTYSVEWRDTNGNLLAVIKNLVFFGSANDADLRKSEWKP